MERGANVNISPTRFNGTPFFVACSVPNNIQDLKLLLEKGTKLNVMYGSKSSFHEACKVTNNIECVKFLFQKGAKVNSKNSTESPLHYAINADDNV